VPGALSNTGASPLTFPLTLVSLAALLLGSLALLTYRRRQQR
jgi:hypothetical protein